MSTPRNVRESMEHAKYQKRGASFISAIYNYFSHHVDCAGKALDQFNRSKWLYGMTLAVIGIAIAIPFGFYLTLNSVHQVFDEWHNQAQISLYLTSDAHDWQIQMLQQKLGKNTAIEHIEYIDKETALRDFESISGFNGLAHDLGENPLPNVINITPQPDLDVAVIKGLQQLLLKEPLVENATLDLEWLQRLDALLNMVHRASVLLGLILCVAVVLIISNSIRLMIEARKSEIEVIALIGATKAFVRRPFLYTGFWLGLFGGIFACITITIGAAYLNEPVQQLGQLYHINWSASFSKLYTYAMIIAYSTIMGLVGAWLAVARQTRQLTR